MKAMRMQKVRLGGDTQRLDDVVQSYLLASNWLSQIVFESKETSWSKLCKGYYPILREKFGLTSQLSQSLCRAVAATYKTARKNKRWKLAVYKRPVFPIVFRRDFSRTKKGVFLWKSPLVLECRRLPLAGWSDSKLKRIGKIWYLLLCYKVEVPDPKVEGPIVGVDFGIRRLMVATNSENSKGFFWKGGQLENVRRGIRSRRGKIQTVGSRSSCRLLGRLSRKEAAVTAHVLHAASKALVRYAVSVNACLIVMEDLNSIRESSLDKGKLFRSKVNRWPFAKARFMIEYKSQAVGIGTEVVDPRNTSRECPCCHHVEKANRNRLVFICRVCGYRGDADRVASVNIGQRSVQAKQRFAWMGTYKYPKANRKIGQSSELFEMVAKSCVPHGDLVSV